ncbi:MAG: TonB family protein [Bacteroidota bacterium]
MNTSTNALSIPELLREIVDHANAREYAEALATLEIAHSSDPDNIYFAALKRQLESLFSLNVQGELSEPKRRELIEPLAGIAECVLRDARRARTAAPPPRPTPEPVVEEAPVPAAEPAAKLAPPPAPEAGQHTEDAAKKELEALKLLYFQRASKFVMKGEYEQALAEVQRVFIVDPENLIAKQYATRVEELIEHARKLASEPVESEPEETPEVTLSARSGDPVEEPQPSAERSTAWDDLFEAPPTPATIPDLRTSPPPRRETVAYGNSLAASLRPLGDDDADSRPARSLLSKILVGVVAALFIGGGAFTLLSMMSAGTGEQPAATTDPIAHEQPAESSPALLAQGNPDAATIQTALHVSPGQKEPLQAASTPPPAEKSVAAKPQAVKSEKEAPADQPAAKEQSAPPTQQPPVAEAVAEPRPAEVEPAPESPTFVAVEKEPQIIKLEKPQFPDFVWKTGIEGQVVLRVLIDAEGKPTDTQVLKSSGKVFEEAVIEAVMKSQFAPAQMGQGQVTAWLTIPFRFKQPK